MERLKERLALAEQTLGTLKEILREPFSKVIRDAAIQRFEYSFEALWKAAMLYLQEVGGIDIGSPKGVIRSCLSAGILDETSAVLALEMADQRNLSVHTYNEKLAQALYERLPAYADLMSRWLSHMEKGTQ